MRPAAIVIVVVAVGLTPMLAPGCGSGLIRSQDDNNRDLGEACTEDSQCASGDCMPYGEGQVCSTPCVQRGDCDNGASCEDLGPAGQWCLPGDCMPECAARCCGDDGCGGECADICPGDCEATTCLCSGTCEPSEYRPCTANGVCSGTQMCLGDGTWSECASADWECTSPGEGESCDADGCAGTRTCQTDCIWSACTEDCAMGETCCVGGGCTDQMSDPGNCGECGRVCDQGTQLCYDGACPEGCARNGSEICDDEGFQVPAPPVQVYLVCDNDNGGVAYISTNTGPPMIADNVPRCQGWEEQGLDAWDYLDYIVTMDCNTAGQTLLVDLSAYVGQHLHFGSHDQPGGGGHMTMVCIAFSP